MIRHSGALGEPSGSRWRGCAVTCRGHKGPRGGCRQGVAVLIENPISEKVRFRPRNPSCSIELDVRCMTDDHVVVALLANQKLEHARKGHETGQKQGSIWGEASSQLRAARRIGRPTPQHTPPGGMCVLTRPFSAATPLWPDWWQKHFIGRPEHPVPRARGHSEMTKVGNRGCERQQAKGMDLY